jgi:hypothetical protein
MSNLSGTLTLGGTSQQIAGISLGRRSLTIQNVSDDTLWYSFGRAAVQGAGSYKLEAGELHAYGPDQRTLIQQTINVIGPTTTQGWTADDSEL